MLNNTRKNFLSPLKIRNGAISSRDLETIQMRLGNNSRFFSLVHEIPQQNCQLFSTYVLGVCIFQYMMAKKQEPSLGPNSSASLTDP